jgi:YD repeat-containing protein
MNRVFVFAILLLGLSCSARGPVNVNALKFPDFERQAIAKNSVDTTFLISTNWSLRNSSDTIGAVCYDTAGRIIADYSNKWESFKYSYDSLGFPQYRYYRDFDVPLEFKPMYSFKSDSMILYQTWTGDYTYTCKFFFDSEGNLLKTLNDDPDNKSGNRAVTTTYTYSQDNKLIKETEIIKKDDKLEQHKVTSFFYSKNNVADFTRSEISADEGNFKVVTYYDDRGLKVKTIKQDSLEIRYIHHRRSGT